MSLPGLPNTSQSTRESGRVAVAEAGRTHIPKTAIRPGGGEAGDPHAHPIISFNRVTTVMDEKKKPRRIRQTRPEGPSQRSTQPFPAEEVWASYEKCQAAPAPFDALRYPETTSILQSLHREHDGDVVLSQAGSTLEGRTIWTLQLGRGPVRILVWSRQHGDEKICMAAHLNALNYLLARSEDRVVREILDGATILSVPVVNPDGMQRYIRRNSMGIDANRDAQKGITAEGKALLRLKEEFAPALALNLHDMSPRKSTQSERKLAALAVQAGPFDEWGGDNEIRRRAKRICTRMAEAAGLFALGHITRYDAPYMPRSFGDSMMKWGVPTCLVESGGWWDPGADEFVARLHFLALIAGLHAAATGSEAGANAAYYDSLPLDAGRPWFDLVVRDPLILDGAGRPRFRAEIGINHNRYYRRHQHEEYRPLGTIKDLGDLSEDLGKTEIDGRGILAVPGLVGIAPALRLDEPEGTDQLLHFLEAGFTTVIGGCGPFADEKEFQTWRSALGDQPLPVNYMAFEVLNSLSEVMERHGQTQAFGILVPDLSMTPADLLAALQLFHPAAHSALTEGQEAMGLTVDLMLHAEGHPRTNRLHLLVRPMDKARREATDDFVPAQEIQNLFAAFIRHPAQIGVTVDTTCPVLGFFPTPPHIGGLGGGRVPPPDFLARMVEILKCSTEEGLGHIVSRLTRQPALALGLHEIGLARVDYRADVALFEYSGDENPAATIDRGAVRPPAAVIVNGLLSFADGKPTGQNGGLLLLR